MPQDGCFVDSMLLVLLVAGRTDRRIIGKHRRLDTYSDNDYETLLDLIEEMGRIVWVTPNTLTEASNLLGQHASPEREQLLDTLSALIFESREVMVESAAVAGMERFRELGLADSVLLSAASKERPLLTSDGQLHIAALALNAEGAINFNHHRPEETLL